MVQVSVKKLLLQIRELDTLRRTVQSELRVLMSGLAGRSKSVADMDHRVSHDECRRAYTLVIRDTATRTNFFVRFDRYLLSRCPVDLYARLSKSNVGPSYLWPFV